MSTASLRTADDLTTYRHQVDEAAQFISARADAVPSTALILGTGLGGLADRMAVTHTLPYDEIPHFPVSTVDAHAGRLLIGTLDETPVVAMQGRMHAYEDYGPWQLGFPVRVLGTLGIDTLLISNAAGGLNPHFSASDIMLITDHINFLGLNPLTGPNHDGWGPRFPDMSEPYDPALRRCLQDVALEHGIKLQQGVYMAALGPSLETKAEYRFMRQMGADAVGMSTVPEVLVARHMGIRVAALSVITDECFPDALEPVHIDDVLAAADAAKPQLTRLVTDALARIAA
ncbi:purine-nucleoside phosphorylase [Salisaeta longa]|uniref:purine-nucleoside phosphorylase n=1 Tax=Salisaeta longa TaxID=503170 RepID=UPI000404A9FA|nr:purine-nucleoside phosphorylase [Salisaeta longa]